MPLPNVNSETRCEATCRARGERCLNLKAFGTRVCRFHGARRTAPKGELNGRYKTGGHVGYIDRCAKGRELRELLAQGIEIGMFPPGTALPGRKPKPRT